MMPVYLLEARHIKGHEVYLKFNTGESGAINIKDIIEQYPVAKPLHDPEYCAKFYLDSWPTLAWDCGFDIAPETLYFKLTGKRTCHTHR